MKKASIKRKRQRLQASMLHSGQVWKKFWNLLRTLVNASPKVLRQMLYERGKPEGWKQDDFKSLQRGELVETLLQLWFDDLIYCGDQSLPATSPAGMAYPNPDEAEETPTDADPADRYANCIGKPSPNGLIPLKKSERDGKKHGFLLGENPKTADVVDWETLEEFMLRTALPTSQTKEDRIHKYMRLMGGREEVPLARIQEITRGEITSDEKLDASFALPFFKGKDGNRYYPTRKVAEILEKHYSHKYQELHSRPYKKFTVDRHFCQPVAKEPMKETPLITPTPAKTQLTKSHITNQPTNS